MAGIELRRIHKSYQGFEVIHGIDLAIEDGGFTVLVGPSGCGKSTLLRMMAGLEEVTAGEVLIDGRRCDHLLPSARGMAMVFQSYALYPHMSVAENLRFGLENFKTPRAEIERRVAEAAEILQISHLLKRRPHQLSGGQSQRVAIGRAIVKEPKAFLLDEPLSNLDAELRVRMRGELVALHRRLGATMIYVTHDQVEAMTMASRIVVLHDGVVEQAGSPIELYARPANRFVAGFLGAPTMNMLPGRIAGAGNGPLTVRLDDTNAEVSLTTRLGTIAPGDPVTLGIRPEHLRIGPEGPLAARVETVEVLGAETILHMRMTNTLPVTVSVRGISGIRSNDMVHLELDDAFIHLFDGNGQTMQPARSWQDDYLAERAEASVGR